MVARLTVQARGGAGRSPAALLTVAPGCEGGTSDVDLDAYLREFGAALARRDAQTSATLWGLPGMLFADDFAKAFQSREDVAAGEAPAFPIYERIGLSRIQHTVLERMDVTDKIVRVRVRWHFLAASDEHLTDVDFDYTLRLDDGGLRVYVATPINVFQQISDLAERRGISFN